MLYRPKQTKTCFQPQDSSLNPARGAFDAPPKLSEMGQSTYVGLSRPHSSSCSTPLRFQLGRCVYVLLKNPYNNQFLYTISLSRRTWGRRRH